MHIQTTVVRLSRGLSIHLSIHHEGQYNATGQSIHGRKPDEIDWVINTANFFRSQGALFWSLSYSPPTNVKVKFLLCVCVCVCVSARSECVQYFVTYKLQSNSKARRHHRTRVSVLRSRDYMKTPQSAYKHGSATMYTRTLPSR